jgi:hypothetical protein
VCFRESASLEELEESLYRSGRNGQGMPQQWSSSRHARRSWSQTPVANNTYSSSSSNGLGGSSFGAGGGAGGGGSGLYSGRGYGGGFGGVGSDGATSAAVREHHSGDSLPPGASPRGQPPLHHLVGGIQQNAAGSSFGGAESAGDTRMLYDSDSDSSPMFKQVKHGSTPGTPLYLPAAAGSNDFVPAMPGGRIFGSAVPPSPGRRSDHHHHHHHHHHDGAGSGFQSSSVAGASGSSFSSLGPRDLLNSVAGTPRF